MKIKEKYSDERRTEIVNVSGEVTTEDLIPNEKRVITFTKLGYIKNHDIDSYNVQRRGGKGLSGMSRREDDVAEKILIASNHDYLMFFTNLGRVYRIKCFEIPESSRTAKGLNIVNLISLGENEKVTSLLRVSNEEESNYIVMVTKRGIIKRCLLSDFSNVRKNGVAAIKLWENDELRWVEVTDGNKFIFIATKNGKANRFEENKISIMGKQAHGVKAIKFKGDDEVVGFIPVSENDKILTISETGFAKITDVSEYPTHSRASVGVINYHTSKYGKVAAVLTVELDKDIMAISSNGMIIRFPASSISEVSRSGKGVKAMRLPEGTVVVSATTVDHQNENDENGENL